MLLFKKGDREIDLNYKPVLLTNLVYVLMKDIMKKTKRKNIEYLGSKNLYVRQYGFRRNEGILC